jgi:hypothetical protein
MPVRKFGGRPSRLSVLDKLIVMLGRVLNLYITKKYAKINKCNVSNEESK